MSEINITTPLTVKEIERNHPEIDIGMLYPSSMIPLDEAEISQDDFKRDYTGLREKVEEIDEDPIEDSSFEKPVPLCFVLSREQTKEGVQQAILKAVRALVEKSDQINGSRVEIKGFEYTGVHHAQNKAAKKIFADAIEWGLSGFFFANGFEQQAREIYCIAHVRAQMKSGARLRFKKINSKHVNDTIERSMRAYLLLLVESEQFSEEELATLYAKKMERT